MEDDIMKIKMNGAKSTDTLYENAPLHKAVFIITSKRLAALPVINAQGVFVGIIGVNGLLEMLLPQAVRSALDENFNSVPGLSFMETIWMNCYCASHCRRSCSSRWKSRSGWCGEAGYIETAGNNRHFTFLFSTLDTQPSSLRH